jgi:hypothetical protein
MRLLRVLSGATRLHRRIPCSAVTATTAAVATQTETHGAAEHQHRRHDEYTRRLIIYTVDNMPEIEAAREAERLCGGGRGRSARAGSGGGGIP